MRLILPGLLCIALAGCAGTSATPPQSPAEAACRRQAERDPQVAALSVTRLSNAWADHHYRARYEQALQAAMARCMTGRGQPPPGGVEKVQ